MLAKEAEWIQTLPDTSPTFKSSLAQEILKQSTSKQKLSQGRLKQSVPRSNQGSILKYIRKRKKSPLSIKQNKIPKHDELDPELYKKKIQFSPDTNEDNDASEVTDSNDTSPTGESTTKVDMKTEDTTQKDEIVKDLTSEPASEGDMFD